VNVLSFVAFLAVMICLGGLFVFYADRKIHELDADIARFLVSIPIEEWQEDEWPRRLADYEAGIEAFEPDELWAATHLKQPATARCMESAQEQPQDIRTHPPTGGGGPQMFDPQ
jgi:hypothetical protein